MWQNLVRKLLAEKMEAAKRKNASFSMRSLARMARLSPGALSEIMNGKRTLSPASALRIVEALKLPEEQRHKIVTMIRNDASATRQLLPAEAETVATSWYYFAILCLFELSEPPSTVEAIAERLNLDLSTARTAVTTLLKLGLLQDNGGHLAPSGIFWTLGDGDSSAIVRAFHLDGLELAKKALQLLPMEKRDFVSLTFAGSSEGLKVARQEIRACCNRISRRMSRSKMDSVYRLNVQLFPVNK